MDPERVRVEADAARATCRSRPAALFPDHAGRGFAALTNLRHGSRRGALAWVTERNGRRDREGAPIKALIQERPDLFLPVFRVPGESPRQAHYTYKASENGLEA